MARILLLFFLSSICFQLNAVDLVLKGNKKYTFEAKYTEIKNKTLDHFKRDNFEKTVNRKASLKERLTLRYLNYVANSRYKEFQTKINATQLDSCDLIIFKDGEEFKAIISEVNDKDVKFYRCGHSSKSLYIRELKDVFMIKYSNGDKKIYNAENDHIRSELDRESINPYRKENTTAEFAGGIALGFLLGIFGLIAALFFRAGNRRSAYLKGWAIGFLAWIIAFVMLRKNK